MEKEWSYENYQIKEGLKPGSEHFQYFFVVSKDNEKQCNYCIWIEDEALSRFDQGKKGRGKRDGPFGNAGTYPHGLEEICFHTLKFFYIALQWLNDIYFNDSGLIIVLIKSILTGSIVWITKLKMLIWKMSLRFVRRVDTKMAFTLCSERRAVSPNGFLSAHPVTTFLI